MKTAIRVGGPTSGGDVGIDELMLHPLGADATARLDTLGRAAELVRQTDG